MKLGGTIKSFCSRNLRDEARQTFTDNAKGAWRVEKIYPTAQEVHRFNVVSRELLCTFCSGDLILLVIVLVLICSEGCPSVAGRHDEGFLVLAVASLT